MTKRELVARLTREPIVVQQIAKLTHYRVALHGDRDRSRGVWLGLAHVAGALLVEDYAGVEAHVDGKIVRLTYRETEAIMSRLRRLFRRGGLPKRAFLPAQRAARSNTARVLPRAKHR
jgi:hypothetical protein